MVLGTGCSCCRAIFATSFQNEVWPLMLRLLWSSTWSGLFIFIRSTEMPRRSSSCRSQMIFTEGRERMISQIARVSGS